jgi:hypothetical protein
LATLPLRGPAGHKEAALKRSSCRGDVIGFSHTSISVTVGFSDGASK